MGLDMYLDKEVVLRRNGKPSIAEVTVYGDSVPAHIILEGIHGVTSSAMQWRKANAIHKWFVDNVQGGNDDCGAYFVPFADLLRLRDECRQVLADLSLAEGILPPQAGFFFGSTDIDESYVLDLKETADMIDREELIRNSLHERYGDAVRGLTYTYSSSW